MEKQKISAADLDAMATWGDREIAAWINKTTRTVRNHRARKLLPEHEYNIAGQGRSRPETIKQAYAARADAA